MLWKDDVQGICQSLDMCFDGNERVRCGPCAIKQSAALGIECDLSVPNLPEVSRLNRRVAELEAALSSAPVAPVGEGLREASPLERWAHDDAVPLLCAIKATLCDDQMDDAGRLHFTREIQKSLAARATQPPGKV
jgi:hypothetical protein